MYHFLEQKLQRIEKCENQNVSDFARIFEQIQLTNWLPCWQKRQQQLFFHFIALKACHVDIKDGTKEIQQKAFYYFYHCKFFRCQRHFQPKSLKSHTKNLILDIIQCKQTAIIKLVFAPFDDNFCLLCNVVINAS